MALLSGVPFATLNSIAQNVTSGRQAAVAIIDPLLMPGFINHPDLEPAAEEARARLDRVAAILRV